jgi:hypothetical protein
MQYAVLSTLSAIKLNPKPRHRDDLGTVLRIPPGTTLQVHGDANMSGMSEVSWNTERYAIFNVDLREKTRPLLACVAGKS